MAILFIYVAVVVAAVAAKPSAMINKFKVFGGVQEAVAHATYFAHTHTRKAHRPTDDRPPFAPLINNISCI